MRRALTAEHKHKISEAMKGSSNPNFGGLSKDHRNSIKKGMLRYWSKRREKCLKTT
ncbi:MAG: NUMOD3 domain-containing DNA-binding protein [Dysgonomonas sp.]